jgi:hypothetical protein
MEKLQQYRKLIEQILEEYSQNKPAYGEIEVETIFDRERDRYQIVYLGWKQQKWIHTCALHLDIKQEKIWIQWNGTEKDIAAELVALGVPKDDIVLGFQTPFMRQFTDYAVS